MANRWLTSLLLLLLVLVHVGLWMGEGGLSHALQLEKSLSAQEARIAGQKLANIRLQAEVEDLKNGLEMVEERARSELGMVRADDIYVQYATARR